MKEFLLDANRICEENKAGATTVMLDILHLFTRMLTSNNNNMIDHARRYSERFIDSHSSMAQVINICSDVISGPEDPNEMLVRISNYRKRMQEDKSQIVSNAIEICGDFDRIISISNSILVTEAIIGMKHDLKVVIGEGRPMNEGLIMARRIRDSGKDITVVVDAALAGIIGPDDAVMVGCDCITPAFFVNKVGTLPLAVVCEQIGASFFVLTQTSKFLNPNRAKYYRINKKPPEELGHKVSAGIKIENKYFEQIPMGLVTKVISEQSVSDPAEYLSSLGESQVND